MLIFIGYVIVVFCVFGGYMFSGGHMAALIQPFEFMIIGGAALGSFITANNLEVIKSCGRAVVTAFKGTSYKKEFFIELLSLFFQVTTKIKKEGALSIESDVENYKESPLFSNYQKVLKQERIMEFFCDYLRLIVTGRVNAEQLELLMDQDIETFEAEKEMPIAAITKVADGLPAFGIVAAVMGIVITMQSLGGPPEELGEHVAKALVGTFLGVLLGYGFTGPIAAVLENQLHTEITILQSIKVVLIASLTNMAPVLAVEFARKLLYSAARPTGSELEIILKDIRSRGSETKSAETTESAPGGSEEKSAEKGGETQ